MMLIQHPINKYLEAHEKCENGFLINPEILQILNLSIASNKHHGQINEIGFCSIWILFIAEQLREYLQGRKMSYTQKV